MSATTELTLDSFTSMSPSDRTMDMVNELAERGELEASDWVQAEEGVAEASLTYTCGRCGETHITEEDESTHVRTGRRNTELWCSHCSDRHAFYCTRTDELFSDDHYSSLEVEGSIVCHEVCVGDLFYWDSDDEYHWEPEPEPEDDERDDPRADYHDSPRDYQVVGHVCVPLRADGGWMNFRMAPLVTRPSGKLAFDDMLGVELEVEARNGDSLREICATARELGFIAERDGSLDEDLGVELVGRPETIKAYRKGRWAELVSFLSRRAIAWDAGREYGMHVSINRVGMDLFTQGKILCWFKANRNLCQIVAGRKEVHWAKYVSKKISHARMSSGDKYEAAAIRSGNRIEIRIFRSTLKWESFLKNLQFVQAVIDFCRTHGVRSIGDDAAFLDMISRSNRYRELAEFVVQKDISLNGEPVGEQLINRAITEAIATE